MLFDCCVTSFAGILVLMVGFALPSVDKAVSDNVEDLVTNFGLGAVTHEFVHCSPFADIVFESVDKFTVCFVMP